jgi:putative phosphoesterase
MNALKQLDNGLFGTPESIAALETKKDITLLILSDSHGQTAVVKNIVKDFGPESDCLIFCGDGISDILEIFNKSLTNVSLAQSIPSVAALIRGNGDSDRYPVKFCPGDNDRKEFFHEIKIPRSISFVAGNNKIYLVHGYMQNVYWGLSKLKAEAETAAAAIVLFGHTHLAARAEKGPLYLNPGSCSIPRKGLPPSFALLRYPAGTTEYTATFYEIRSRLTGGYK